MLLGIRENFNFDVKIGSGSDLFEILIRTFSITRFETAGKYLKLIDFFLACLGNS